MLLTLVLYYSSGTLQLQPGRQLQLGSAQQVAQQAHQLLAHSRSFDSRIKPWALGACVHRLTGERRTTQRVLQELEASGFTEVPAGK